MIEMDRRIFETGKILRWQKIDSLKKCGKTDVSLIVAIYKLFKKMSRNLKEGLIGVYYDKDGNQVITDAVMLVRFLKKKYPLFPAEKKIESVNIQNLIDKSKKVCKHKQEISRKDIYYNWAVRIDDPFFEVRRETIVDLRILKSIVEIVNEDLVLYFSSDAEELNTIYFQSKAGEFDGLIAPLKAKKGQVFRNLD